MVITMKLIGLKTKRRKLVNGLSWLLESQPDNPKITEMTDQLQQINLEIDKLRNEIDPKETNE